jgi:hypothetical protein
MIIQVDTNALVQDFLITRDQEAALLDFTAKEVTAQFASEWELMASSTLKSSRQQYISSIIVVDEGFAKGAVALIGKFPNMLEQGIEEFDIKEGLLNGPNAKTGANGARYNTVPYDQGTPGSLPENFNGGIMPEPVHKVIKSKPAGKSLKQNEIPKPFEQPKVKVVVMPKSKVVTSYEHKSSIYEGLVKNKDSKTGQNTYGSFRRVSDNSEAQSWIHPGLEARGLADKALNEFDIPAQVGLAFDKWWTQNK